jgi:hypothetical protein
VVHPHARRSHLIGARATILSACLLLAASASSAESFRIISPMLSSSGGVATAPGWSLYAVLGSAISDANASAALFAGPSATALSAVEAQNYESTSPRVSTVTFSLNCASQTLLTGTVQVTYSIGGPPGGTRVLLRVFDVAGRAVSTLYAGNRLPGVYKASWNAGAESRTPVSSGIYFCHLDAGTFHATTRLVVVR